MRLYNLKNRLSRCRTVVFFDLLMLAILIAGIIYGAHYFSIRPPFEKGMDEVSKWAFFTVFKSFGIIAYATMFSGGYFVLRLFYVINKKLLERKPGGRRRF